MSGKEFQRGYCVSTQEVDRFVKSIAEEKHPFEHDVHTFIEVAHDNLAIYSGNINLQNTKVLQGDAYRIDIPKGKTMEDIANWLYNQASHFETGSRIETWKTFRYADGHHASCLKSPYVISFDESHGRNRLPMGMSTKNTVDHDVETFWALVDCLLPATNDYWVSRHVFNVGYAAGRPMREGWVQRVT